MTDQVSFSYGVPARVRVAVVQLMIFAWPVSAPATVWSAGVPLMVASACGLTPSTEIATLKLPALESVKTESEVFAL